ncbi:MAG: glycosyltransferase family 2 protein [Verrucomicrobiales bacterium]|nr:glycosyltransferase family 2 protein [Verrucomicrobiales bacterium]
MYSIIIPARDEEECVAETVRKLSIRLTAERIPHQIVVVDDGSNDATWEILTKLRAEIPALNPVRNPGPHGFGRAIVFGLKHTAGDAVTIMMADESDSPNDAVAYWQKLNEGFDCVFGSRFMKGGLVVDYPWLKLKINRLANLFIQLLFTLKLNDTTNAFKAYRREVIDGVKPILSPHFNITVELPLKAIVRGYSWTMAPINWQNRKSGESKLKIKEMGSRYLFIVLYVWLEKYFSRGDYKRKREH